MVPDTIAANRRGPSGGSKGFMMPGESRAILYGKYEDTYIRYVHVEVHMIYIEGRICCAFFLFVKPVVNL